MNKNKNNKIGKERRKEKDKFIINNKYINYKKEWNDILIASINIAGGLDKKISTINKYMKTRNIDVMVLNEVKIAAEEFYKIKNKFKIGKAYFNGFTKEELQKEYQLTKEKEIDNLEINERNKEIRKLQINKQKAPNKSGIIVIINNEFHSNTNIKKNLDNRGIMFEIRNKKENVNLSFIYGEPQEKEKETSWDKILDEIKEKEKI